MAVAISCTSVRSGLTNARMCRPRGSASSSRLPLVVRAMVMPRWFTRNATSGLALRVLSNAAPSTSSVNTPKKSYISYGMSTTEAYPSSIRRAWPWKSVSSERHCALKPCSRAVRPAVPPVPPPDACLRCPAIPVARSVAAWRASAGLYWVIVGIVPSRHRVWSPVGNSAGWSVLSLLPLPSSGGALLAAGTPNSRSNWA